VRRRGLIQDGVDDAGAVEADHHRQPPRNRRGFESALLLQPPYVQLNVDAPHRQRIQVAFGAPAQEDAQVGVGVDPGKALILGQVRGHCDAQQIIG
jgi:hypothetical protein